MNINISWIHYALISLPSPPTLFAVRWNQANYVFAHAALSQSVIELLRICKFSSARANWIRPTHSDQHQQQANRAPLCLCVRGCKPAPRCLNTALISHAAAQMQTFQTCYLAESERERESLSSAFVPALWVIKTQKETFMVHKYARTLLRRMLM